METRTVLPVRSAVALLALACGAATAATNSDFSALKAHWSFDEGRDWHNMPSPFKYDGTSAYELTGKADALMLNKNGTADNAAWISGRQHAGIAPGRVLSTMKELHWLNGSVTFSYWTRLNGAPNKRGVVGSNYTTLWGMMNDKG